MKIPALLYWLSLGLVLSVSPTRAWAGTPPVVVEVVVDGEDDFFEAPSAPDSVKKRAERAQDGLEDEAAVRTGTKGEGANVNTNTQVVKVVVVGGEQQQTPAPVAPAPALAAPVSGASSIAAGPVPSALPGLPAASATTQPQREWWDADSYASEGEFLLSTMGGGHSGGGFLGLTGEGLVTDQLGLRLSGMATAFTPDLVGVGSFNGNFDVLKGGLWANQRPVTRNNLKEGFAFLMDASLTYHLLPHSMFDPYAAVGLAHYGYEIHFDDRTDRGGAGYGRLGAGANLHFSRFFAGADFGWYPLELFRYALIERNADDFRPQGQHVDDRFVAERYVVSIHGGLRF